MPNPASSHSGGTSTSVQDADPGGASGAGWLNTTAPGGGVPTSARPLLIRNAAGTGWDEVVPVHRDGTGLVRGFLSFSDAGFVLHTYDGSGNTNSEVWSLADTLNVAAGRVNQTSLGVILNTYWAVDSQGYEDFRTLAEPADGFLLDSHRKHWYDDTAGAPRLRFKQKDAAGTVTQGIAAGLSTDGGLKTFPPVSSASTLALGTAYQNTLGYDVMLVIYLSVTVNTSGVLKLGVGSTSTPTQQTLVTGLTATGLWPVPIYLPNQYYALLSVSGTITVAIDGQIAMPV